MKLVEVKRVPISDELRSFVMNRDKHTCRYCGKKAEPLHLDHVYPVAKGGETSAENLVAACLRCNVKKHTKIMFPKPIGYFENDYVQRNKDYRNIVNSILSCACLLLLTLGIRGFFMKDIELGTIGVVSSSCIAIPMGIKMAIKNLKDIYGR